MCPNIGSDLSVIIGIRQVAHLHGQDTLVAIARPEAQEPPDGIQDPDSRHPCICWSRVPVPALWIDADDAWTTNAPVLLRCGH